MLLEQSKIQTRTRQGTRRPPCNEQGGWRSANIPNIPLPTVYTLPAPSSSPLGGRDLDLSHRDREQRRMFLTLLYVQVIVKNEVAPRSWNECARGPQTSNNDRRMYSVIFSRGTTVFRTIYVLPTSTKLVLSVAIKTQ